MPEPREKGRATYWATHRPPHEGTRWAARGLLWAGPGRDSGLLGKALNDDAWRVREMLCKVVARYRVGDLLDDVAHLESDPTQRVRAAAAPATASIIQAEA